MIYWPHFYRVFLGIRRSHVMANRDNRSLGFAIVEVAHPHQCEGLIQALDGWVVGNHSLRVAIVPPIEAMQEMTRQ